MTSKKLPLKTGGNSYDSIPDEEGSPISYFPVPSSSFPLQDPHNGSSIPPPSQTESMPRGSGSSSKSFSFGDNINNNDHVDISMGNGISKFKTSTSFVSLSSQSGYMHNGSTTSFYNPSTVARPIGHEKRKNSVVNVDELTLRMDQLQSIRPKRLVGDARSIFNWKDCYRSLENTKGVSRKVKGFYRAQNQLIDRYTIIDKLLDSGIHMGVLENYNNSNDWSITRNGVPGNIDFESGMLLGYNKEDDSSIVYFAIMVNFVINIFLLVGKLVIVLNTMSMSMVASLIDSTLDFLSTIIIFISNKFSQIKDSRYPIGKKRLEPLGVLIFSIIIIVSFLQVAQESLSRFLKEFMQTEHTIIKLDMLSIGIMITTIIVKLICFIWCTNINNSSIQALAEDAKTDIIFNFFSIIFPILGDLLNVWWFDSIGALSLCIYVIYQWIFVAYEHISNLTGANASEEDYQQILYLCVRFAESIEKITNFKTYHVGDNINVEVDISLNYNKYSMKDCHDIGEALQYAIETLPFVERCFVHIDYREGNFEGHLSS